MMQSVSQKPPREHKMLIMTYAFFDLWFFYIPLDTLF